MSTNSVPYVSVTPRDDVVRLVQLTDTHLKSFAGGKLLGLDTDYSLQAVIDLVRTEYPEPDLILGTGDLADSGAPDAYQRLLDYFSQITSRHYWLPGNHDVPEVMREVAGEQRMAGELRVGRWQIVMLNSQIPGEVGGRLGERELARLESALDSAAQESLYSLVCLHHQPIPVGSSWLDEQMVADGEAFLELLKRYPLARGVLWGHVHQELEQRMGELLLMCSPSTCVQFMPGQRDFTVDTCAPGYRWLELSPAGVVRTGISRAREQVFPVDRNAGGYL